MHIRIIRDYDPLLSVHNALWPRFLQGREGGNGLYRISEPPAWGGGSSSSRLSIKGETATRVPLLWQLGDESPLPPLSRTDKRGREKGE